MKILIGPNNFHKYKNNQDAFKAYAPEIELLNPGDLEIKDDPAEDSDSLLGNAVKKAKFFGDKSKLTTITDDTGLFVDALNGEPGLHTKRWHEGSDHDRCVKLLERLEGKNRTAYYGWAVAAYDPTNNKTWTFECRVDGLISDEFIEKGGFGYDKMFQLAGKDKHYSELSKEELVGVGGRGRAIKELILNTNFLK